MEVLKFKLSGKTAFFKKPEVNTYYYFTYGQIHKPALLGIFGAILGYRGYGAPHMEKGGKILFGTQKELPEYYQKLCHLKIGIEPCNEKGYIPKKIQTSNNSVGYASEERGGNLIVKEQWLETPAWNIYILVDGEESRKLKDAMQNHQAVYVPYLGKNEHPADISGVCVCYGKKADIKDEIRIQSMFLKQYAEFDEDAEFRIFKYEENLPIGLEEETLLYQLEKFVYTNMPVVSYQGELYELEGKHIVFI